jgi:hypothetical protein
MTRRFKDLPVGRKFQYTEGLRACLAVKISPTEVTSRLGIYQYTGNAVFLLESDGRPSVHTGNLMVFADDHTVEEA